MCVCRRILCVSFLTWLVTCSASEDPQVKTVQPGEDVLLPCQGPRGADIVFVRWIKTNLDLEGSVCFFRDDHTDENYQHPSFHDRMELTNSQMKDGDVSVILKNVTIEDTGTYECQVGIKENRPELISTVQLQVKYSGGGAGHTEDGGDKDGGDKDGGDMQGHVGLIAGLSVLGVLVIAVVVGLMIFIKRKGPISHHPPPEDL